MNQKRLLVLLIPILIVSSGWRDRLFLEFNHRELEKSMKKIEAGTFTYGDVDPITAEAKKHVRTGKHSVADFHICDHEVTNKEYQTFLAELKKSGDVNWEKWIPDTLVWKDKLAFGQPYVELYFQHPAYNDHPVIGVSHSQAEYFCKWLTDKYNHSEKRKYAKVVFRLPTENEWTFAAMGGGDLSRFAVSGNRLTDEKGLWAANFKVVAQWAIERNDKDGAGLIAPPRRAIESDKNFPISKSTKEYQPNGYGLYNMSGNVEEMVAESGISKGGSWDDTGYYLQLAVYETYEDTEVTKTRGFRIAMDVLGE